ncbi:MAG: class I SAM-dependent methyltransferase [Dehalococcoidia bacterium]
MNEYFDANRRHWDEVVPIHAASDEYDVASFKAGKSKLKPIELAELPDVRGKTMLHMQCHFGLDTLSWAREGAIVTGADFSEPALEQARALAVETSIEARFVLSNVYELPEKLNGRFDIVFTSYGALNWLPDIEGWARVAAHFVKPGGTFYIAEFHPMASIFDDNAGATDLRILYPYFPLVEPMRFDDDGTYADLSAKLTHRTTYEWPHPISEVVTALINAGLRVEFLHEFPFSIYQQLPFLVRTGEKMYRLPEHDGSVPLLYSIKATKDL